MEKEIHRFRIVKFSNATSEASSQLDEVIANCRIVVDNWMEKDYGLVIFAEVPECHLREARSGLGNIHGVTYSE
jgi:hypothetical protein